MTSDDYYALMDQGSAAWNQWRNENPEAYLDMSQLDLKDASLGGFDLSRADFSRGRLKGASLIGANLTGANFREAHLTHANLSEANLTMADLRRAQMPGSFLRNATLTWTDFSGADLRDADFDGARLGHTILGGSDLSTVRGLANTVHDIESTIGIDTLYLSHGKISPTFLRNAQVASAVVALSQALADSPTRYYSCFISHSSKDAAFVRSLCQSLRDAGVDCWYSGEDLRPGENFPAVIEGKIRSAGKLIVVLSRKSLDSEWVKREMEYSFSRERREGRLLIIPLRLDEAVMEKHEISWAASLRDSKHMLDCNRRKHRDAFEKTVRLLLEALRVQGEEPSTQKASES